MSKTQEPLIYRVKNDLWEILKKKIPKPEGRGRRATRNKECFEAILYVLRTGCQWCELPSDYPPKSTVHYRFQRWIEEGIFQTLWQELLIEYDDLIGLNWEWLSVDSSMVKSPLGGEKKQAIIRLIEANSVQKEADYVKEEESLSDCA